MPSAKPKYDPNGSWKNRQFTQTEWEAIEKSLKVKLRGFYPNKKAIAALPWGHPADEWSNTLLNAAESAITMVLGHSRRLTNEELRAEQKDLLNKLKVAAERLRKVSDDLIVLLDADADLMGTRDKINELIPHLEASSARIDKLPKAQKSRDAKHAAAVEMAICTLRIFKGSGGVVAATANSAYGTSSDAIKILTIIGDALDLDLDETTWKKVIIKAKKDASDL